MSRLDENSSAFRGRVIMVVSKAPCIVKGDGEGARQELAPKLSIDRVKGTWKAINMECAHTMKWWEEKDSSITSFYGSESRGRSVEVSVMETEQ
ncbi:hypothetical protein SAMN05192533_102204 [Mesobacillus persicus]|uniref:Uncharacterized protein n=1 Tax=Mesobacillus persicus TaxID=930146 RepID=A0A1H7XJ14_9BACI|nr:hypothetical protein [Mesobacillus persicus]SEM33019.1 hypothetical protein SAMN05192533_102204 [Mesobacillus persicus]